MAEHSKDMRARLMHTLYETIQKTKPADPNMRVSDLPKVSYAGSDGQRHETYVWDTPYILSSILKTGNVATVVEGFFNYFNGGETIARAITQRSGGDMETVLYSVFTVVNYSLTDDNWDEAQLTVKGIAEASTKYHGQALTTVIKRVADMAFFLFSPEQMNVITDYLKRDSIAQQLNANGGSNLGDHLRHLPVNYEKSHKSVFGHSSI